MNNMQYRIIIVGVLVMCWLMQPLLAIAETRSATVAAPPPTIVSLVYHRIDQPKMASTHVTTSRFESHLQYLKANGYVGLTASQLHQALRTKKWPQRAVVITADNGFMSFFEHGWPLLKRYGFPVTVFVSAQPIHDGYGDFVSWPELRALIHHGSEVGIKGWGHESLDQLSPGDVAQSITRSQNLLAEKLGVRPTALSYPSGRTTPALQQQLQQLGITVAFTQVSGVIDATSNPLALPRYPQYQARSGKRDFAEIMTSLPLPLTSLFFGPAATSRQYRYVGQLNGKDVSLEKLRCLSTTGQPLPLQVVDRQQQQFQLVLPLAGESRIRLSCVHPTQFVSKDALPPHNKTKRWRRQGLQFYIDQPTAWPQHRSRSWPNERGDH